VKQAGTETHITVYCIPVVWANEEGARYQQEERQKDEMENDD
jgi:hypothetical protein